MTVLKQITTRAKQIYKKGKAGISWIAAIKRASAQIKGSGPKRTRKVVRRKRRVGSIGKGPRPLKYIQAMTTVSGIKRKRASLRTRTRRVKQTRQTITTRFKKDVKQKLAAALLSYDQARTRKATIAAQKRKVKYRKILNAL